MRVQRRAVFSSGKNWNRAIAAIEVSAWRKSGLSLSGYARRRGVHVRRLQRWKRRLEKPRGCNRGMTVGVPGFLPVRVVGAQASR